MFLYEARTGKPLFCGDSYAMPISSQAGSPRALAATAGRCVFDLGTGAVVACLTPKAIWHSRPPQFLCGGISADGKTLAAVLEGQLDTVTLFDLPTETELGQLPANAGPIQQVAFVAQGQRMLSLAHELRLWDLSGRKMVWKLMHHESEFIRRVAASRDGSLLGVGYDSQAELRDMETLDRSARFVPSTPQRFVRAIAFDDQGRLLALEQDYSQKTAVARVYDVAAGREVCRIDGPAEATKYVLSPTGSLLATEVKGTAYVFDAATGKLLNQWPVDSARYSRQLRFTSDDKLLVQP